MSNKVRDIIYIGIFAVLISICAWITVPTAVPFTLQSMGVFTAVGLLGGKRGSLAVVTYILLGMIGLPVFSGFSGGIGVILNATGGYIIGFLLSALVMWGIEKFLPRKMLAISMIVGLIVCYIMGTTWFMAVYMQKMGGISLSAVLGICVVPFVIPDLIKILLSVLLVNRLKKTMKG